MAPDVILERRGKPLDPRVEARTEGVDATPEVGALCIDPRIQARREGVDATAEVEEAAQ